MANAKQVQVGSTIYDIEDAVARSAALAAQTAAEAATTTANEAKTIATTAQTTATAAQTTANNAATAAATADSKAVAANTAATEAKTASDLATARMLALAPLAYPLKFKVTEDTSAQDDKYYYTYQGDNIYKDIGGHMDNTVTPHVWKPNAFVAGTTYYEVDDSGDQYPQIFVNASGGTWEGFDPKKFRNNAAIYIGLHARCIPGNDGSCWNTAIGQNSQAGDGDAGDQCTAIGEQTKAIRYSCTAIGSKACAQEYGALAIGWGSECKGFQAIAIGRAAKVSASAPGAIMLGPGTNTEASSCYFGVSEPSFSVVTAGTYAQTGTSYFTRSGSGTTADPYIYSKYNIAPGDLIPSSPVVYTLGSINSYTYKLLGKDGKIPTERLNITELKAALGL